jgi:hypothetical protein
MLMAFSCKHACRLLSGMVAVVVVSLVPAAAAAEASRGPDLNCDEVPCSYSLTGGRVELSFGGNRIRCSSVGGNGHFKAETTGPTVLELQGCREHVTVIQFRCHRSAASVHPVRSSPLGTHLVEGGGLSRLKFLGLRMSFACAGIPSFNVEGYLVGRLGRPECTDGAGGYLLSPILFAHGQMGAGPIYDVYVDAERKTYGIHPPWRIRFEDRFKACRRSS